MRSLKISGKASRSRSNLAKYNPHHDSNGRFAAGGAGGVSGNVTNVQIQTYPPDENGEISSRVTGEFKTKSGDTVKLIHDNTKLSDGTIEMETVASVVVPGGAKQIGYLNASRGPKSFEQYGATIDSVSVDKEYRREGVASAMLGFARTYSQDGVKIEHSFSLTDDAKAWSAVFKYNPHHDSRGRFASGGSGGGAATVEKLPAGNGYTEKDLHPQYDYNTDEGYLESYTGYYSNNVNTYFRTGRPPEKSTLDTFERNFSETDIIDTADSMDSLIAQTETPRDMTLFRAIGTNGFSTFENLKVGDVYTDKGFASTTPDTKQLWDFLPANEGRGAVLQIELPKGSQALSVKKYFKGVSDKYAPSADILNENEHILPRGTKFQVTGIGLTRQSIVSGREGNPADLLIKVKVVK
jgi:hypothetical protein